MLRWWFCAIHVGDGRLQINGSFWSRRDKILGAKLFVLKISEMRVQRGKSRGSSWPVETQRTLSNKQCFSVSVTALILIWEASSKGFVNKIKLLKDKLTKRWEARRRRALNKGTDWSSRPSGTERSLVKLWSSSQQIWISNCVPHNEPLLLATSLSTYFVSEWYMKDFWQSPVCQGSLCAESAEPPHIAVKVKVPHSLIHSVCLCPAVGRSIFHPDLRLCLLLVCCVVLLHIMWLYSRKQCLRGSRTKSNW